MMLNKLDTSIGVTPLNTAQNARRVDEKSVGISVGDFISLSDEAVSAAEQYYLDKVAEETPDVRSELVASIKEKIKDPNYLNPERIAATADAIMSAYGL